MVLVIGTKAMVVDDGFFFIDLNECEMLGNIVSLIYVSSQFLEGV